MSGLSAKYEATYKCNKIYFCVFDREYVLDKILDTTHLFACLFVYLLLLNQVAGLIPSGGAYGTRLERRSCFVV